LKWKPINKGVVVMLVIKKKNLVMGLLIVLLIITGYLNLVYNQSILNNDDVVQTSDQGDDDTVQDSDKEALDIDDENVSVSDAAPVSSSNFFVDYRLERQNTRKEEIEYIRELLNNPEADSEIKKEAQAQLLEITNSMEKELSMEALIKAKGFDEVVVIMHKDSVNVIVDKKELKPEEVAQILDIVKRESGQKAENIKIIPKI